MSKDIAPSQAHHQLVNDILPKSLAVVSQTLELDPYVEVPGEPDEHGNPTIIKEFSARINGQRVRVALGVISAVVKLNDTALKRQAGTQLKSILSEIRKMKKSKLLDGI